MKLSTRNHRSGAALVFILLAVIALLAIGTVLLSHFMNHRPEVGIPGAVVNGGPELDGPGGIHENPVNDSTTTVPEQVSRDVEPEAESTETHQPIMFPPPPPPIMATPDPKSLPPEG